MRVDPETYMQEPEDTKVHQTFIAGFNIEEYTDEIASLLKQHTDLDTMMHELGTYVSFIDIAIGCLLMIFQCSTCKG